MGFQYQDLIGLDVIYEWLEHPDLYDWIKFDGKDLDGLKAKGLDDIIAKRRDGKFLLKQVKFTIEPNREDLQLSLDWLLYSKGKGSSNLQKWYADWKRIGSDKIYEASLTTNRTPDDSLKPVLKSNLLVFEKLPNRDQSNILGQLGNRADVTAFFKQFKFYHSKKRIEHYEAHLREKYCKNLTNTLGWYRLTNETWKWSGLENYPDGTGKIFLHHIRDLLSVRVEKTIPQSFAIPEGYLPPKLQFFDEIFDACRQINTETRVIWGPPGRGKSTLLSYLVQKLIASEIPTIRHHYFLSQDDQTIGRWQYSKVASSLLNQLSSIFPEIAPMPAADANLQGKLNEALNVAASLAELKGFPLVVIIDGLDHVHRDAHEVTSLNLIFAELFPTIKNVVLLVGTQRVSDDKLPTKLLENVEEECWFEIPMLGFEAVESWLKAKLKQNGHSAISSDALIQEMSTKFLKNSSGHPLYLNYSFQRLQISKPSFGTEDIDELPTCIDGDIRKYYRSLWLELSSHARHLLHLFSCFDMNWPDRRSLVQCFDDAVNILPAYLEIQHLLQSTIVGKKVFHESILVFCREQKDHCDIAEALYPLIQKWLENHASELSRRSWLWIAEYKQKQKKNLVHKISKHWVYESLLLGVPESQIILILTLAEESAFYSSEYARAVEIRHIKTRLLNVSYQGQNYHKLLGLSLGLNESETAIKLALSDISDVSVDLMISICRTKFGRENNLASECLEEMNRRVSHDVNRSIEPTSLAVLAANLQEVDIDRLIRYANYDPDTANAVLESYLKEAIKVRHPDECLEVLDNFNGVSKDQLCQAPSRKIGLTLVRMMFTNKMKISDNFDIFQQIPLIACKLALLGGVDFGPPRCLEAKTSELSSVLSPNVYHDHFFCSLWWNLRNESEFTFIERKIEITDREFSSSAFKALQRCADFASLELKQKNVLDPLYFYELLSNQFERESYRQYNENRAQDMAAQSFVEISFDLAFLSGWNPIDHKISEENVDFLNGCQWWQYHKWSEYIHEYCVHSLEKDAARHFAFIAEEKIYSNYHTISDLSDELVDLTEWCLDHSVPDLASKFMLSSLQNFLGYGWRKDITMNNFLEGLEHCRSNGIGIHDVLERLEPIVLNIVEFTDGKETYHTPQMYFELVAKTKPEKLASLYNRQQKKSDWSNSEDIIRLILEYCDLSKLEIRTLICTSYDEQYYDLIENRINLGHIGADELKLEYCSIWGARTKFSSGSGDTSKSVYVVPGVDVSLYSPKNLISLIDDLNGLDRRELKENHYYALEIVISNWIQHWFQAGKGTLILGAILEYAEDKRYLSSSVSKALDTLAESTRVHLSRREAFDVAVLSNRVNNGWSRWYSSGARDRLDWIVEHFLDDWEKYIQETALSTKNTINSTYGITIGQDLLMYFLSKVGQKDLAKAVTTAILTQIEHDVDGLKFEVSTGS